MSADDTAANENACTCTPCESPQYGVDTIAHCVACCWGTLIEEYDPECPVGDHAEMARRQYPPAYAAAARRSRAPQDSPDRGLREHVRGILAWDASPDDQADAIMRLMAEGEAK